jgi:hypothetical protein
MNFSDRVLNYKKQHLAAYGKEADEKRPVYEWVVMITSNACAAKTDFSEAMVVIAALASLAFDARERLQKPRAPDPEKPINLLFMEEVPEYALTADMLFDLQAKVRYALSEFISLEEVNHGKDVLIERKVTRQRFACSAYYARLRALNWTQT